jgi:Ras-related protein Rab-7A
MRSSLVFVLDPDAQGTKLVYRYWTNAVSPCRSIRVLDKFHVPYFETSAKEGLNVEKAFETIARNALAREKDVDQTADFPAPIRIPEQNMPKESSGCPC